MNPLSYPRYLEYHLALSKLGSLDGCRVLDIGSPKLPVLLLARHAKCELYATDIRDYFIGSTRQFLTRMGMANRIGRDLHLDVQDARTLTYVDGFFDKIYAISVVEHIPGNGDATALSEIARVLRPGGVATLTVPFRAAGHQDEYVTGAVFERDGDGSPTFYQRRYDIDSLRTRLVEPSGPVLTTPPTSVSLACGSSRCGTAFQCAGRCRCCGHSRSWPSCSSSQLGLTASTPPSVWRCDLKSQRPNCGAQSRSRASPG